MTCRLLGACLALAIAMLGACGDDDEAGTPEPSAASFEVAPGVFATIAEPPAAPAGAVVLSDYYILESEDEQSVGIGVALKSPRESTVGLGFYTSDAAGDWQPTIGAITLVEGGAVLEGVFPSVPDNIVVLEFADGDG